MSGEIGLVAFGAVLGAILGGGVTWAIASRQRKLDQQDTTQAREAEVLADLTMMLEAHDLSTEAVTKMDNIPDRRAYFERWRPRIEAAERDVRAASFLDKGSARQQGFDTAEALGALLAALDEATNQGATQASYNAVDESVLRVKGEVTTLGGFWKDD